MNIENLSAEELLTRVFSNAKSTPAETRLAQLLVEQIDETENLHVLLDNLAEAGDDLAFELRETTGDEDLLDAWDALRKQVKDLPGGA